MFSIEYEDWKRMCSRLFNEKVRRKQAYLQWFPFSKLTKDDKAYLLSEKFFNKYILSGAILYYKENWFVSDNYLTKSNGNLRHSSLVSPMMYLIALLVAKTISKKYISKRPKGISAFYAGNFQKNRLHYKKDYDDFCKRVNELSQQYRFFIKADIENFFPNIDINLMFDFVDKNCNSSVETQITQKELLLYKELFSCLGQGEFPLIENSPFTSYLATIVYLENTDVDLHLYLSNSPKIIAFEMVRYVDDLYIFFDTEEPENKIIVLADTIIREYSSILFPSKLALNKEKTVCRSSREVSEELKKSTYDEEVNGKEFLITDLVNEDCIVSFFTEVNTQIENYQLDGNSYAALVNKHFRLKDVEFSPQEIYNSLAYNENPILQNELIIEKLENIIKLDYSVLRYDKRLLVIILKTKNENLIKALLNSLFIAHRNRTWNVYDTVLAINYLVQRNFEHNDLIEILKNEDVSAYWYYVLFCQHSFVQTLNYAEQNYIQNFVEKIYFSGDKKLFFLLFLYRVEKKKQNYMSAFAYYKNFFDRISAHIGKVYNNDCCKGGKPNYNNYYKESQLKQLYGDIDSSNTIITITHKLRNSNPLSHASAGMIDNESSKESTKSAIADMEKLIIQKVTMLCDNNADLKE